MKIIVTSDLHGSVKTLNHILYNYNADLFLDCGDSQMNNYQLKNFETVLGNCDNENFPKYRIIDVCEGLKIFITHGHLYSINDMIKLVKDNNCNIILHGHTHIKRLDLIDGIYVANPGSITKPRSNESNNFLEIDYNIQKKEISFNFIKITL